MTEATPSAPPVRLPLLDGMRGIAALAVLYYHSHHYGLTGQLILRGYLFVDFFFLLSGFVLALSAEPKLAAGAMSAPGFIRARVRRLWPVLAVGVAVGLIPYALRGVLDQALMMTPLALLLVPALFLRGKLVFPLNSPHWSLSLEFIANVAHAFVLSRLPSRYLALLVGAAGLWLGWAIADFGSNEFGAVQDRWVPGLPRVFFSYGCGILLAREYRRGGRLGRLPGNWALSVFVPLAAVITSPLWPVSNAAADIFVTLVLLPAMFALTINARLPDHLVPLFAGLGLLSYPLYAVHLPILLLASRYVPAWAAGFGGPAVALCVAAVVARALEVRQTRRRNNDARPAASLIA